MRSFKSVLAIAAGLAVLTAGCGGSTNNSNFSNLRVFDACPNGGTGTVTTTSGPISAAAFVVPSTYAIAPSGTSAVTFTLSGEPAQTYPGYSFSLNTSSFYTTFIMGRADITNSLDPRFPKLVIGGDDQTSPASNDCRLRFVDAAPDAGIVDVYINGILKVANMPYSNLSAYLEQSSGAETVQVNIAGTATALVPSTPFTTVSGLRYTVVITEPTIAPTYSTQILSD